MPQTQIFKFIYLQLSGVNLLYFKLRLVEQYLSVCCKDLILLVNDVELKLKRRVDELKDRKEGCTSRQIELGNMNSALSITILQRNACKIALGDLKETELKQIADLQAR